MRNMFRASKFNQPLNEWHVDNVTNMQAMFNSNQTFNQPLNDWDVSSVKYMGFMFSFSNFNQPLNSWDVSSVADMHAMFQSDKMFNQPLNRWVVSSVKDMSYMFSYSNFNQPLNSWNVSSVTNTKYMFQADKIFNQPLDRWDVSSVTNMEGMFRATTFNKNLRTWDVNGVSNHKNFALNGILEDRYNPFKPDYRSIITSPANGVKVDANTDITVRWENHGAARIRLSIVGLANGKYSTIYRQDVSGTSHVFRLPTDFTRGYVYLYSYDDESKYIGRSVIYLYPKPATPPSNLNVINITKNSATLTWNDNSNNETGFKIYRNYKLVQTVGANVTTINLTGLSANTSYTYTVKAYNGANFPEGISKTFTTLEDIVASKSIITSPANKAKVAANTDITVRWENHGAARRQLIIVAKVNGKYSLIYKQDVSGTSHVFRLPTGFTNAYVYVYSFNESKYIGHSLVYLYPKQ